MNREFASGLYNKIVQLIEGKNSLIMVKSISITGRGCQRTLAFFWKL